MKITRTSPFSQRTLTLDLPVTVTQMSRWEAGAKAQDIFSNLNADEREFIMTGIAPGEWEEYLGPSEE